MKKTTTYGPCPVCAGTGKMRTGTTAYETQCQYCNGSKQVVVSVTEETEVFKDWMPPINSAANG